MTIGKVIRLADALKPNAIENELKYQYITEVEGLVQTEVMLLSSEDIITYDPERDGENTELLVKPPHDKLYIAYLAAMIDFANGEYDRYANTIEQFNAYYREYHRWYFSRFHPADGRAISEGYYLSAYAIAVKHGYEGSEEEFAAAQLGKIPELRYNADVLEWKYTDEGDDAWRALIDVGGIEDAKTAAVNAALTAGEQAGIAQGYSAAAKEYAEQAKVSSTLGMTAANVGDYAKVAEVDENGVPTRFEAADIIDENLTEAGKAADASAVGERFSQLSEKIANLPTGGVPVSDLKSILTDIVTFLKAVPFDDTVVSASDLDDIQNKIDALGSSGGTEEPISATFSDGALAISGVTVNSALFTDGVLAIE